MYFFYLKMLFCFNIIFNIYWFVTRRVVSLPLTQHTQFAWYTTTVYNTGFLPSTLGSASLCEVLLSNEVCSQERVLSSNPCYMALYQVPCQWQGCYSPHYKSMICKKDFETDIFRWEKQHKAHFLCLYVFRSSDPSLFTLRTFCGTSGRSSISWDREASRSHWKNGALLSMSWLTRGLRQGNCDKHLSSWREEKAPQCC